MRRLSLVSLCALWFVSAPAFAGVDLVLNLTDAPDPVAAGGVVTYTVRVSNNGTDPASGVTVTHAVPGNTEYQGAAGVSCSGMAVGAPGPGTLTCTYPDLTGEEDGPDYTVQLRTTTQGVISLGTTAAANEVDDDPSNNAKNEQTTVGAGANVAMLKTPAGGIAQAQAGSIFSWTLAVSNAGPDAATLLRVEDPIPPGFNVTGSLPTGCSSGGGIITCNIAGPIASGATHPIGNISGVISAASSSTVTNSASVALQPDAPSTTPRDPDTSDNTAISNVSVTAGSDLKISKSRSVAGNFLVGDTFNFILKPSYSGDAPHDITVTDTIPANYTVGVVAASQNGWMCGVTGQVVTCDRPGGGSAGYNQSLGDITIPVTVASAGSNVANTAAVSALGPDDPNPANNSASDGGVNLLDPTVDLGVGKTGPVPALVVAGVPFDFEVRASNGGTTGFYGDVVLTDTLPANMTVTAYDLNGWSCSPAVPTTGPTITCTRTYTSAAPLLPGANTPAVKMTAEVSSSGVFNNSVRVTTPDCNLGAGNCGDGDLDSYSVTSSIGTNAADIRVLKSADLASVPAGDVLTYTLEIVNDGPMSSSDVVLTDTLQELINGTEGATGAGYVGHTITPGLATGAACSTAVEGTDARKLTCNFATIPICTAGINCPKVEVKVRPGGDGDDPRENTANVISNGTADPDHSNETATVVSTIEPRADATVAKTVTPDPVPAGQELTYVITAKNAGPSRAENVTIVDTLPHDVTFISAAPSTGSCSVQPAAESVTGAGNDNLTCNLGTVNRGSQQTVTVKVRPTTVTRGNTLINEVDVTTSTVETDSTNNHAQAVVDVEVPSLDLVLNKTDSIDPIAVGDDTVYTITVTNNGPSAAENVVMTDTLPTASLSYQSHTTDAGSCTVPAPDTVGGTVSCQLGTIPAGVTRTITVTMKGTAKGAVNNHAAVASDETALNFEDDSNNAVDETTTVRTKADVAVVSKTPSATPVDLRDSFNFVVRVRNNTGSGLAEADEVEVNDNLPTGMVLTATPTVTVVSGSASLTTCTGSAGDASFKCKLGTVSSGGEVDITVPVKVISVSSNPQTLTNTAAVTTKSLDVNSSNNSNHGDVVVRSSSISGKVFRDFDNDGAFNGDDSGIAGIDVTLTGTAHDGTVLLPVTVTTDADGNYSIEGLPAGNYTLTEGPVSDINLVDGKDTAGSAGGDATSVNDVISDINLPGNTGATDYLFAEIPIPRIGIAKSASAVTNNGNGTYDVEFSLVVRNYGATRLENVQVTDDVTVGGTEPGLGTYTTNPVPLAGEYTIVGAPTVTNAMNGANLTPVAAGVFTGSGGATSLLDPSTSELPNFTEGSRSSAIIRFTVRFFPNTPGPFENNAHAAAESPAHQPATDDSVDGSNPDANNNGNPNDDQSPTLINLSGQTIGVAKQRTAVTQTGEGRYQVSYSIVVVNPGTITATNVQVTDDLNATFPTALSRTITTAPVVSACTGTVLNADATFNGGSQQRLLVGNQPLQPAEQCKIDFTAEVDFGGSDRLPAVVQNNQAVATTAELPGGIVIATDLSNDGATFVAEDDSPTPVDFSDSALASISGKVWRDIDHDRVDNEGPEERVAGFIVEVLNASGQVVGTAITAADGTYKVTGLYPYDGTPATAYSVRFREPTSGNIYGVPLSQDPDAARNGTVDNGVIGGLQLAAGVNTTEQNLPLDPSGVVYDSVSRIPVSGATVTLLFGGTEVPAACLVGGQNAQVTGTSGMYQYLLINPTPAGCPGNGEYTIKVQQPSGYLPPASTIIPPQAGAYTPVGAPGSVDPIQPQAGPPTGAASTVYYFALNLTIGGVGVVNNHIPLDPAGSDVFFVTKTGSKSIVELGDTLKYTVQARVSNGIALAAAQLTDNLPAGFRYIPGTATIAKGGAAAVTLADPAGSPGPRLVFEIGTIDSNNPVTVTYRVRAGVGAMQGDGINRVQGRSGSISSNIATFKVKVTGGVFTDLACVAGKVFVDCNDNHIQDAEEIGIPGVRLYMEDGTYFVTDVEGKYSYCGITPRTHVLKADSMTLPRGSRLTVTSNRNVGDANSIFLDVKNGELIRADFAEGSCSNTVLEQVKARRGQGEVRAPETEKRGAPALKFEGKAPNYPQQGTESANQILVKPRGGSGDAPLAESVNDEPVQSLPDASGNTRGSNLRDQQRGGANVR